MVEFPLVVPRGVASVGEGIRRIILRLRDARALSCNRLGRDRTNGGGVCCIR